MNVRIDKWDHMLSYQCAPGMTVAVGVGRRRLDIGLA